MPDTFGTSGNVLLYLCKSHAMPIVLVEFGVLINSNVIVFWVDTEYEPSAFEWGIQCCQISSVEAWIKLRTKTGI